MNFVEKTFAGGYKIMKFVKIFSLESFPLYVLIKQFVYVNDSWLELVWLASLYPRTRPRLEQTLKTWKLVSDNCTTS